jgi:A/G-specific adenine glycosylase
MSGGGPSPAVTQAHQKAFRCDLTSWFDATARAMPWRSVDADGKRDPYRVWVSEVMLQQTRVDQARPFYERFVTAFPTIEALAAAELDDVLRLWEGLGYYSRARSLHRAAREVVERFGSRVPADAAAMLSLPGVGPYTAAAVLSLAYDVPLAALDGNVIRVLSRVFACSEDVTKTEVRRTLQMAATSLLDRHRPGRFNEAVMELGAVICTPRNPRCPACPLRAVCLAAEAGDPERFPVARRRAPVPHHDIAVAVISDGIGRVLIQQRPQDAMLGGLWEFPGGKVEPGETPEVACVREAREELGVELIVGRPITRVAHAYSHFRITLHAFHAHIQVGEPIHFEGRPLRWVTRECLDDYPFPRANRKLSQALLSEQHAPSLF